MSILEELSRVFAAIENEAATNIGVVEDLKGLDDFRIKFLGKKGILTAYLKQLKDVSKDDRPSFGQLINNVKEIIEKMIQNRYFELIQISDNQLNEEAIDITLSGRGQKIGSLHPITKVREHIEDIFTKMGFIIFDDPEHSPEIEDEWHNFTALNIPKHHPARSASDTFYLENSELLLRTQTSPAQIRALETLKLPLRVITPGRVYRRDFDVTHVPMFHQLEGLLVSEQASFSELKFILNTFLESIFNKKVETRFRPSYFPFTEPSAEIDLRCFVCNGEGCRICKQSGWIEIGGNGMVHPNVLKAVGVNSDQYTGFAFGLGIDRLAMFYYGINDIRMLFENDIRLLRQF
jgi:phenylalanyl-tRNA synthetase alpha chain